jgi:hypothetical protein
MKKQRERDRNGDVNRNVAQQRNELERDRQQDCRENCEAVTDLHEKKSGPHRKNHVLDVIVTKGRDAAAEKPQPGTSRVSSGSRIDVPQFLQNRLSESRNDPQLAQRISRFVGR